MAQKPWTFDEWLKGLGFLGALCASAVSVMLFVRSEAREHTAELQQIKDSLAQLHVDVKESGDETRALSGKIARTREQVIRCCPGVADSAIAGTR